VCSNSADFDKVLAALQIGREGECWRDGWTQSQKSFGPEGLFFLNEGFLREVCGQLSISAEVCDALIASLDMFQDYPALKRLAWHGHVYLFRSLRDIEEKRESFSAWPMLPDRLCEHAPMFYAFVLLSGVRLVRQMHRHQGVPVDITLDTLSDFELWIRDYRQKAGKWGLIEYGWLSNHFMGQLFRLGRLQFCFDHFKYDFHAYRSRHDRRVMLLAGDGMRFRGDGQFDGTTGVHDLKNAWTSEFSAGGGKIRGSRIAPDGMAVPETVELTADQWELILQKGDPTLDVHIPAGVPMAHEACGESFKRALAFFPRYFPRRPFCAFNSVSWFLDNQFDRMLSESSNIRRFQREVYLYPVPDAYDSQTFERVFGKRFENIDAAPRKTSLQRLIVDHVKSGGHWRSGGCLLFPEDFDWGRQVYRTAQCRGTKGT
jgi:hypothetical protein